MFVGCEFLLEIVSILGCSACVEIQKRTNEWKSIKNKAKREELQMAASCHVLLVDVCMCVWVEVSYLFSKIIMMKIMMMMMMMLMLMLMMVRLMYMSSGLISWWSFARSFVRSLTHPLTHMSCRIQQIALGDKVRCFDADATTTFMKMMKMMMMMSHSIAFVMSCHVCVCDCKV